MGWRRSSGGAVKAMGRGEIWRAAGAASARPRLRTYRALHAGSGRHASYVDGAARRLRDNAPSPTPKRHMVKEPPPLHLKPGRSLPDEGYAGTLVARFWRPDVQGPSVVALRASGVYDLSADYPTMRTLLAQPQPARCVHLAPGQRLGSVQEILAHSDEALRHLQKPFFLAPCDLQ